MDLDGFVYDLGFWISDVFMFLNFVTDFILVSYYVAAVIFVSFAISFTLYHFHCFYHWFCFVQLFSNVVPITNNIPTSLFHITVVTLAILYMRNYSLV